MKLFRTILCSLLALLVLISSSSFMVNMHLCGGHVQSISVIEKATACAMELAKTPPCHKSMAKKKSCCTEDHIIFEGKHFKLQDETSLQLLQSSWVVELPLISSLLVPVTSVTESHLTQYSPPLIDRDITVQVQSFLI
ncbi:MAG: hypothetical protein JNM78_12390 [Cyclobacteriaceae bacterium]|nr:hypothetical protein [Cyclobacteriaceae bacterium]